MATLAQVGTIVEQAHPDQLKPHPKNAEVYGDSADSGLVDSIRSLGVQQAIYAKRDGTIISGHRRWYAAKTAGIAAVPVVRVEYPDDASEWEALVEHNRYRAKTLKQFANEGTLLETVRLVRAPHRPSSESVESVENFPHFDKQRDAIADRIGLGSGKQWDKLKTVKVIADDEANPLRPVAQQALDTSKTVHQAWTTVREAERKSRNEETARKNVEQPTGLYDVAVIDPPWPMTKVKREVRPNQADFDYPTLSVDQIKALEVPLGDTAHVWLWTTHKYLPCAFDILDAWGLTYICTFTWCKPGGFQPYGLPQFASEFALYSRKGRAEFTSTKDLKTWFTAPRGRHSEKPDEFYQLVSRVTQGRKLDYFGRKERDGFEIWGNEAEGTAS